MISKLSVDRFQNFSLLILSIQRSVQLGLNLVQSLLQVLTFHVKVLKNKRVNQNLFIVEVLQNKIQAAVVVSLFKNN